jgi:23S rRNA (guanine745-N1)-methyltransferase
MSGDGTTLLACPACREPLRRDVGAYVCPRAHTFDIARSGYVNLLNSRKKLSPTVGDSKEMLAARQRFLDAGHYSPLTDALQDRIPVDATSGKAVAEIGSGTGHHIGAISRVLGHDTASFGFDISKDAAQMGARHYPDVTFAVADVKRSIPLIDDAAITLLDVFSPRNVDEFARVLDPEGSLIVAVPGPDHLKELVRRFGLLTVPGDKIHDVIDELGTRFTLAGSTLVSFEMHLEPKTALDVISMGPSARHVDLAGIEDDLQEVSSVTAAVMVLEFRRR